MIDKLLQYLFTKVLKSDDFPCEWREGDLLNLFKKGDRSDPGNYRGIILLDTLSKLYNLTLNHKLDEYIENNNILHYSQNGFRKQRSCNMHVFSLSELLYDRKKQNKQTFVFFLDLKKAFDTVPRSIIYETLVNLGVDLQTYQNI